MIEVQGISKKFESLNALSQVNFSLAKGEVVGLLGVNGAGKSTLMKILAGVIEPSEGIVSFMGQTFSPTSLDTKRQIGYLSEDNPLYEDMYVREYLEYVSDIYAVSKDRIAWCEEQLGLQSERKKKIKVLSKGNRQRVGLAQALLHDPCFFILDEPTSGLDPNQRESLHSLLLEIAKDKVVLLSTHILQDVRNICSRILVINQGVLVADMDTKQIDSIEEIFYKLTNENNSR